MRHRATQLILPFEPALPGRQLILAPRLWPTMTPTTQQQLAKRVAQLLRSMLAAADAGDLIGGITMNMLLNLESPVTTAHRAKLAYIYVRQSTAGQVRQHQESESDSRKRQEGTRSSKFQELMPIVVVEIETIWGPQCFTRRLGEALHPDREPLEPLARIRRTIGEYNFAGQYQQVPRVRASKPSLTVKTITSLPHAVSPAAEVAQHSEEQCGQIGGLPARRQRTM